MEAEIAGQAARERSALDFEQFLRTLDERRKAAVFDLRGEAAARNLAFQPAFVGVGMRDIRDEVAQTQGQASQNRAAFLAGVDREINRARQFRDTELAAIAREQARAQADHQRFIDAQLAAVV